MGCNSHILKKDELIDDKYQIAFFLKKGSYAETHRVIGNDGKTKLFKSSKDDISTKQQALSNLRKSLEGLIN